MIGWPLDGKEYTSEPIGAYFGTRTRGVFAADDCFAVRASGGFQITLGAGLGWLKADKYWGLVVYDKAETSWTLPVGSGQQSRCFAVAIQYDKTRNEVGAVLKTGEYALHPVKPQPVRDTYYDEIIVATILQKAGAVEITDADITDERENEAMCGLMRDGVTGLPSEMLYRQLRSKFDQLYTELEGLLDGNIAAHLQLQISSLAESVRTFTATFQSAAWSRAADSTWTQTVFCEGMTADCDTGGIWTQKTGNQSTDSQLQDAIDIIGRGYLETLDGQIKATVYEQPPSVPVTVYMRAADPGGTTPGGTTPETDGSVLIPRPTPEDAGKVPVAQEDGSYALQKIQCADKDYVTPEMFGAVGDGVTDDSAAMQSCIDYALTNASQTWPANIRGGNYFIHTPITINTPTQMIHWHIQLEGIESDAEPYTFVFTGQCGSNHFECESINNSKGGCITFVGNSPQEWFGTCLFEVSQMRANPAHDAVHLEPTGGSWCNDNTWNIQRIWNGLHGFYAKGCNQVLINHCDFEYGNAHFDTCNGVLLIMPHLGDPGNTKNVLETVGRCTNFVLVGGNAANFSSKNDTGGPKISLSAGTYGNVISYQAIPGHTDRETPKGSYYSIVAGQVISHDIITKTVGYGKESVIDTRTFTSLECPTLVRFSNENQVFILDSRRYGGVGLINTLYVMTNNSSIDIQIAAPGKEPASIVKWDKAAYKYYKLTYIGPSSASQGLWTVDGPLDQTTVLQ